MDANGDLGGRAWAAAAGDFAGKGDLVVEGKGDLEVEGKGDLEVEAGLGREAAAGVAVADALGRAGETWGSLTGGRAGDLIAEACA